jgi:hypothetical protein
VRRGGEGPAAVEGLAALVDDAALPLGGERHDRRLDERRGTLTRVGGRRIRVGRGRRGRAEHREQPPDGDAADRAADRA